MKAESWLLGALALLLSTAACGAVEDESVRAAEPAETGAAATTERADEREAMVAHQIAARGVRDPAVLAALRAVPRHRFVPADVEPYAYADQAFPIGFEQTISQPYVVAFMTEAAALKPSDRVLEIGTGSGYQAAVLAEIVGEVWTIEILEPLAERAARDLRANGYGNVHVRAGDGYRGWPEEAPFDAILVTAAPDHVPAPLLEQLKIGGRLVIPVGDRNQEILRITRTADGHERESLLPVRFVPMTGEARDR